MSMQFTARIPARSFGFESEHTVLGFEPTHIASPAARSITPDPEHLFEAEFFEEMRLWWEWDDTRSPLYISGPSGCGKTSTVLQFLACVHAPAVRAVSPRVLIRFAQILLTLLSQQAPVEDPVAMALNVAFANGCTREEAFALQQLAHFELAGLTGTRRMSKSRRAG